MNIEDNRGALQCYIALFNIDIGLRRLGVMPDFTEGRQGFDYGEFKVIPRCHSFNIESIAANFQAGIGVPDRRIFFEQTAARLGCKTDKQIGVVNDMAGIFGFFLQTARRFDQLILFANAGVMAQGAIHRLLKIHYIRQSVGGEHGSSHQQPATQFHFLLPAGAGLSSCALLSCALLNKNWPMRFSSTTADWVILMVSPSFRYSSNAPASRPT